MSLEVTGDELYTLPVICFADNLWLIAVTHLWFDVTALIDVNLHLSIASGHHAIVMTIGV